MLEGKKIQFLQLPLFHKYVKERNVQTYYNTDFTEQFCLNKE